jgi:hypothetical protein
LGGGYQRKRKAMKKGPYGEEQKTVWNGELSLITNPACEGESKVSS